ncbi:MAG: transaldolase [Chromatiales bacterium]|jgi:transaldolase|nr:transaldolase [Chromatiales bacterium]
MNDKPDIGNLSIKLFADGADLESITRLYADPRIKGFTTNPTLMRKDGVEDYEAFARNVLEVVTDRPISFEVFADELDEMADQARAIASWAPNVNVKIPVTNTRGVFTGPIIEALSAEGIELNVTAIFTREQVRAVCDALAGSVPAIISVFAGRIADTGLDPMPLMRDCVEILRSRPQAELLWASPRELLNIFHADAVGCHIITATTDLLNKLGGVGKELEAFSLETVKMFYADAQASAYTIETAKQRAAHPQRMAHS